MDQGIVATSLQAHVECMLEDRSGREHDIANQLNEGAGIFYLGMKYLTAYITACSPCAVPSALARPATSPDSIAGSVALELEPRSAIMEGLPASM